MHKKWRIHHDPHIRKRLCYDRISYLFTNGPNDLSIIKNSHFKFKKTYIEWIRTSMNIIQQELSDVRRILKKKNIKVSQVKRDTTFTLFLFRYKGREEYHNYFNPRIRNKVEELMKYYLCERMTSSTNRK